MDNVGFSKRVFQSTRVCLKVAVLLSLLMPVFSKTALLIIDVQNCFLPGGTLPVTNGDDVIPVINDIREKYGNQIDLTVFSQDWHCPNHVSFASEHDGYDPLDVITLHYDSNGNLCRDEQMCPYALNQTLWPDHCVINSADAELSSELRREPGDIVVKKGYNCQVDSYSPFFDNGGFSKTELEKILKDRDITTVLVTGFALDICVYYTSKDAKKIGFDVYTVADASRPVYDDNVQRQRLNELRSIGVNVINSTELDKVFSKEPFKKR